MGGRSIDATNFARKRRVHHHHRPSNSDEANFRLAKQFDFGQSCGSKLVVREKNPKSLFCHRQPLAKIMSDKVFSLKFWHCFQRQRRLSSAVNRTFCFSCQVCQCTIKDLRGFSSQARTKRALVRACPPRLFATLCLRLQTVNFLVRETLCANIDTVPILLFNSPDAIFALSCRFQPYPPPLVPSFYISLRKIETSPALEQFCYFSEDDCVNDIRRNYVQAHTCGCVFRFLKRKVPWRFIKTVYL